MADYAIHDTTLIGISNVIRKKEGSSALIDPAEYAERVNLMGMLEEKTASGAIAHIEDGSDEVPVKSWQVTLPASLDGYSEIGCNKGGKNLFDKTNPNEIDGYITTTGFSTGNANAKSIYIPIVGGVTYTVSKTAGQRFQIATAEVPPANNAVFTGRVAQSGSQTSLTITASANDKYLWAWIFLDGTDTGTLADMLASVQIEYGSTATAYEPYTAPTTATASLGRTIYGGTADVVTGEGEDENGNAFTFTPIPTPETPLGVSNWWADNGDSQVTYRSSGTVTPVPIVPTLISKSITENGTYSAEDDDADGYSEVTVNVQGGATPFVPQFTETLIGDNTSHASSFTLTEDYGNYDMVKIVWYESATSSGFLYTTPDILDEIFSIGVGKLCVNKPSTNYYACYTKSGLTWTRSNQRVIDVHEIYGVTFTNCTMQATDLYKRGASTTDKHAITSQTSLKDYDLFMMASIHATDGSETMPTTWLYQYPPENMSEAFSCPVPTVLQEYNGNDEAFVISEYGMTSARFFMVQGIKFTET